MFIIRFRVRSDGELTLNEAGIYLIECNTRDILVIHKESL